MSSGRIATVDREQQAEREHRVRELATGELAPGDDERRERREQDDDDRREAGDDGAVAELHPEAGRQ